MPHASVNRAACIFGALLISCGSVFAEAELARQRLCGTWLSQDPAPDKTTLVFFNFIESFEAELIRGSTDVSYTVRIDPDADPKQIDFRPGTDAATPPRLGVYHVQDDELLIRLGAAGNPRPTALADLPAPGELNLLLKRDVVPDGWTHVSLGTNTGVDVYEKQYPVGTSSERIIHYVTLVDLRKATVRNMMGGPRAGLDDWINARYASTYWNRALDGNTPTRKLKVLMNGSFFSGPNYGPSRMDHGLKKDGTIWAYGLKNSAIPARTSYLRALSFGDVWARIDRHARTTFDDSANPNVVGGISTEWQVNPDAIDGRNYVGVRDGDADGVHEFLVSFMADRARQSDGVITLCCFGVSQGNTMMLDGGNSTRLLVDGVHKVKARNPLAQAGRRLPHMISIYMGK